MNLIDLDIIVVELAFVAVATLIAGTFAEPLQSFFPWGRAYKRFVQRRKVRAIAALALRAAAIEARENTTPTVGYRVNAAATTVRVETRSENWIERRRAIRDARYVESLEERVRSSRN